MTGNSGDGVKTRSQSTCGAKADRGEVKRSKGEETGDVLEERGKGKTKKMETDERQATDDDDDNEPTTEGSEGRRKQGGKEKKTGRAIEARGNENDEWEGKQGKKDESGHIVDDDDAARANDGDGRWKKREEKKKERTEETTNKKDRQKENLGREENDGNESEETEVDPKESEDGDEKKGGEIKKKKETVTEKKGRDKKKSKNGGSEKNETDDDNDVAATEWNSKKRREGNRTGKESSGRKGIKQLEREEENEREETEDEFEGNENDDGVAPRKGNRRGKERTEVEEKEKPESDSRKMNGEKERGQEEFDEETEEEEDDDSTASKVDSLRKEREKGSEIKRYEKNNSERRKSSILKETYKYISDSWVTAEFDNEELEFIIHDQRTPTKYWFSFDRNTANQTTQISIKELKDDANKILRVIREAKIRFRIDSQNEFVYKSLRGLANDIKSRAASRDNQALKIITLALRFSKTPISEIAKWGGDSENSRLLNNFWIVSQQLLGFNSVANKNVQVILDAGRGANIKNPTSEWEEYKDRTEENFIHSDFFAMDESNPWRRMEGINRKLRAHEICNTLQEWEMFIAKTLCTLPEDENEIEKEIIDLVIKTARTKPQAIPGWDPISHTLESNSFSIFWRACYNRMGAPWKKEKRTAFEDEEQSIDQDSTTVASTGSTRQNSRRRHDKGIRVKDFFFIHREHSKKKQSRSGLRGWKRNFTTFIKVRLPPYDESQSFPIEIEKKIKDFIDLMKEMWKVEPRLLIPAWKENERDPWSGKTSLPHTRDAVEMFCERFWIAKGRAGSFIRVKIAHDLPLEDILENSNILQYSFENDVKVYKDKIQEQRVTLIGWFAGSISSRTGIEDLETALKGHPLATKNGIKDLEIRVQHVNLKTGQTYQFIPAEERVMAMHIYASASKAPSVREMLMELYPSAPQRNYPMGRHMRFVPNVADTSFVIPPGLPRRAEALKKKQAIFLKNLRSTTTRTIDNLFKPLRVEPYATLAEIIMAWKSSVEIDQHLFVAVEEFYGNVRFFYLERHKNEAEAVIPLLSLILEDEFGGKIWEWFNQSVRAVVKPYVYDEAKRQVRPRNLATFDREWDLGLGELSTEIDEDMSPIKFEIEIGEIDLDHSSRERIMDDDSIGSTRELVNQGVDTGQKERKNDDEDTGTERLSIETESTKNSSILSSITNSQDAGNLIKTLLKNKDIQEEIRASLEELDARVEREEE